MTKPTPTTRYFLLQSLLMICATSLVLLASLRGLSFDEVDYVLASLQPIKDSWISSNTLNFADFVLIGLSKLGLSIQPIEGLLPEGGDSFFLRHFHGVLPTYFLSPFLSITASPENARILCLMTIFILFYFVYQKLTVSRRLIESGYVLHCMPSLLFFLSPGVIDSFSSFNFHIWLGLLLLPYIYLVRKVLVEPTPHMLIASGFLSGMMWLTLETSLVISFATLVYLTLFRRSVISIVNLLFVFLGGLLSILILNPGAFISADILKAVLMYAYRLIAKGSAEYNPSSSLPVYFRSLLLYSMTLIPLLLISLHTKITARISSARGVDKSREPPLPAIQETLSLELFIGLVYLVFIAPFTLNPTYLFPAILMLQLCLNSQLQKICFSLNFDKLYLPISVSLLLFMALALVKSTNTWDQYQKNSEMTATETKYMQKLCDLKQIGKGILLFSDEANRLNLYLGRSCFNSFILDYDKRTLLARVDRSYRPLERVLNSNESIYLAVSRNRGYQEKLTGLFPNIQLLHAGPLYDLFKN